MASVFLSFLIFSALAARSFQVQPLEGLLKNGDFEQAPNSKFLHKSRIMGKRSLPEWDLTGYVEYLKEGPQPGGFYLKIAHGHHAVRLGNNGSISQTLVLKPGALYALTVAASRTCAQEESLRLSVDRVNSGDLPLQTIYSSQGDDVYAFGFKPEARIVSLTLLNPGIQEDPSCGPLVDIIAIKELPIPLPTRWNLVRNGGFEVGPHQINSTVTPILLPPKMEDSVSPLPGWIIESLKAVKLIVSNHFNVPAGKAAVELVAGRESAIAQVIRTVPGKDYLLTFKVGDAKNDCLGSMMVEAFAGKQTVKVSFSSSGKGRYTNGSLKFKALGGETRITFYSSSYQTKARDLGSLCGPVLDDVSVARA